MATKTLVFALVVGCPTLAAAAPEWCKPMAGKKSDYFNPEVMTNEEDARKATQAIVGGICNPWDAADTPKAEAAKKKWSELLDMNDQDWLGAAHYWANYDQYADPPEPTKKGYAGLDPLDQYVLLSTYSRVSPDGHYVADAMSPLSEVGRIGYAIWCARNEVAKDAHLAACLHDVAAADIKKASAEIRADKTHEPKIGYMARTFWWNHKKMMESMKAEAEKLKKQDEAYVKMFDIADKTWKSWEANEGKRAKLLAFMGEMDNMRESGSRKAQQGCEDKAVPFLREGAASVPADRFAAVLAVESKLEVSRIVSQALATTPEGYLGSAAYVTCMLPGMDVNGPGSYLVQRLGNALLRWPGYRGPRSAVIADIMQAGLVPDQRDKEITYPSLARDIFGDSHALMNNDPSKSGIGVIKGVKTGGKMATISFNKTKATYSVCVDYRPGTKITGIMANGQFERASTCYKYKQVSDMVAIEPVQADGRFVSGLKPGQFSVSINYIPWASWAPNGKAVATALGVAVK